MFIKRSKKNPILEPESTHSWEAEAVFNGCPIKNKGKIYIVYRAISLPHYHTLTGTRMSVSDVGIAESKDGIHFNNRRRFIVPEEKWERFGCEDPRITKLNDKFFIFYTALSIYPFRAEGIKVGLATSQDLKTIQEKHLITPFNAKAMTLFPEKINGKIWATLTVNTDIHPSELCTASFEKEEDIWNEDYWNKWYVKVKKHSLNLRRNLQDQVENGAPPIKTKYGWLLLYSYIQDYASPKRLFSVEAVLLSLKNPNKIIAKTNQPIMVPKEYYEEIGFVPDVIFPTGAIIEEDVIRLYYGASDTICCLGFISISSLINKLLHKNNQVKLKRAKTNPIISPIPSHIWESKATFNPGAILLNEKFHIIYRAMSEDNTSVLGYATSFDGIHIDYRSPNPIYTPRESFEQKLVPGGNSGCEDPRLTLIKDKIYMLYTAFDGINPPRVAITHIKQKDFINQNWSWSKPIVISPPHLDDKDANIFPNKVDGKYMIIHRSGDDIDLAFSNSLDFSKQMWLDENRWIKPRRGMWDSRKVGAVASPIKTEKGWVLFYHGVSDKDGHYRVGAILLDLKNPIEVISRTDDPILEPEKKYEQDGQVPNVVFPCGAVLKGKIFYIFYGGGDKVVGVATIDKHKLLKSLGVNK